MRIRHGSLVALLSLLATSTPVGAAPDTQVRVLLLCPRESVQGCEDFVRDLEREIRTSAGSLVVVGGLSKAEVLVEVASFDRITNKAGEPGLRVLGHFVPLVPTSKASLGALATAEPFKVVMAGPDESIKRRVAMALGTMLAEVLGREKQPAPAGSI